jgi:N-methylhydantoinase A
VYARETLRAGDTLAGPLIVDQMDSTTLVPPDFGCRVDAQLNLILELREAKPQ